VSTTDTTTEPTNMARQPGAPPRGRTSTFRPRRMGPGYPAPLPLNPPRCGVVELPGWSPNVFAVEDLLPLLVLAVGGAMLVGPLLALVRPRPEVREGDLERPPLPRSLAFMAVGLIASVWAIASLVTS